MNNKSILVIDSGIGGLSTLYECKKLLKNEDFIYYADTFNAPYGDKDFDFIKRRTEQIIEIFLPSIKAVILACNTATSTSAKYLRERFSLIIFGIEPALKQAVKQNTNGKILLLATPVTVNRLFVFKEENLKYKDKIVTKADANLSMDIENNIFNKRYLSKRTNTLFSEFKDEKNLSVVLGCTHYIFIKKHISKMLKKRVKIYDGNVGLARQVERVLKKQNLISDKNKGKITFYNSDSDNATNKKMKKVLKKCNKF